MQSMIELPIVNSTAYERETTLKDLSPKILEVVTTLQGLAPFEQDAVLEMAKTFLNVDRSHCVEKTMKNSAGKISEMIQSMGGHPYEPKPTPPGWVKEEMEENN